MKRLTLGLLALLLLPLAAACNGNDDASDAGGSAVRIGAILPLTGGLASYGETSKAALDEAVKAVNTKAKQKVELRVEDSKSDPATALEKMKALQADGIRVVVGPYSSAEVRAVREYANDNGIIILSPLSTSTALATPGDNILRFTPDDDAEGAALAALAYADGVRTLLAVTRDDEGNKGLQVSVRNYFEKLGGRVVLGATYGTDVKDFKDTVAKINAAIAAQPNAKEVGIYLTAFGEVGALFEAAATDPVLGTVKWYGSDSVAQSKDLSSNAKAAAFALKADYPNPILGLRDADKSKWQPVVDAVRKTINRDPDAFALAAYDALVTAHTAIVAAKGDTDDVKLVAEINKYTDTAVGLTGPLKLNEAGDRAVGTFDFWGVCSKGSTYSWYRTASFTPGEKATRINPLPACQ